jgi:hypothetical protein
MAAAAWLEAKQIPQALSRIGGDQEPNAKGFINTASKIADFIRENEAVMIGSQSKDREAICGALKEQEVGIRMLQEICLLCLYARIPEGDFARYHVKKPLPSDELSDKQREDIGVQAAKLEAARHILGKSASLPDAKMSSIMQALHMVNSTDQTFEERKRELVTGIVQECLQLVIDTQGKMNASSSPPLSGGQGCVLL